MSVPPLRRRRCQISAHLFQGGEGSADGGKLLFISFGVSFRLPFPSRGGEREGGDRHHHNQGKENPPKKPVFGAVSASSRPLNARSHLGAQPTANTKKNPPNPSPPYPQNTKRRRAARAGRASAAQAEPGGHAAAGALPAVRNHAPQGSEPAQIPNYFLLQCWECILDGVFFFFFFFRLSPGKNVSPCAYRRRCRRRLSEARGEVWGLANEGRAVQRAGKVGGARQSRGVPRAHPGVCREKGNSCANQGHHHKPPPQIMRSYSTRWVFPSFFLRINAGRFPQIQPNSCRRPPCNPDRKVHTPRDPKRRND